MNNKLLDCFVKFLLVTFIITMAAALPPRPVKLETSRLKEEDFAI